MINAFFCFGIILLISIRGAFFLDFSPPAKFNCSTRVIRKLLSIPLSLHGGKPSFDVQLSELKHAIKCCEDCIPCKCATRDEMTIRKSPSPSLGTQLPKHTCNNISPRPQGTLGILVGIC